MIQNIRHPFEDSDIAGYQGPGWYFWDETGMYCYGPYRTKSEAAKEKHAYAKQLQQADKLDEELKDASV